MLELALLKEHLAQNRENVDFEAVLQLHAPWYLELRRELGGAAPGEIEGALRQKVGEKFLKGLADAGVFKRNEQGLAAFDRFVENCTGGLK